MISLLSGVDEPPFNFNQIISSGPCFKMVTRDKKQFFMYATIPPDARRAVLLTLAL